METFRAKSNHQKSSSRLQNVSVSGHKLIPLRQTENSGSMKRDFKTATEIIARRIMNNQLEFNKKERSSSRKSVDFSKKPVAVRMNNVVIQRILHIQMKETKKNRPVDTVYSRAASPCTCPSSNSKSNSVASVSTKFSDISDIKDLHINKQNFLSSRTTSKTSTLYDYTIQPSEHSAKKPFELPRFQLSTKQCRARYKMENSSVQTNLDRENKSSCSTQTNFTEFVKMSSAQTTPKPSIAGKKLQTRLYKQSDNETNPVAVRSPSKSTNTYLGYYTPYVDRHTQLFDYMSEGDLFCLDWINKHLFPIELNPYSVIVDQKIRELSEMCTKSTLFSESKTLRTFQCVVESICDNACCQSSQ